MKRYTPLTWADVAEDGTPCGGFSMHPLPDGEWVSYEDAHAEIARLQQELDASCNAEELRQVRAERDRMRAALAAIAKAMDGDTMIERHISDMALTALRPAV